MRSTPKPTPTPQLRGNFLRLSVIACALATASCAGSPLVANPGPAPQLEQPAFVTEPCGVTATPVNTLADLESRDRARGVDVQACDAKRSLAVQVHKAEHDLEAQQLAIRDQRNGWFCRTMGWGCPK